MFVSVWQGAISFSSSHFYTFLMYVLNCIVLYCFYSSFDFICIYWMVWFYTIFFKGAENIIILMIFIYLVTCYIVRNIVQACKWTRTRCWISFVYFFFFFLTSAASLRGSVGLHAFSRDAKLYDITNTTQALHKTCAAASHHGLHNQMWQW